MARKGKKGMAEIVACFVHHFFLALLELGTSPSIVTSFICHCAASLHLIYLISVTIHVHCMYGILVHSKIFIAKTQK